MKSNLPTTSNPVFHYRLLSILVLFCITALYFAANIKAPVQRDGSYFLFMANNIADGQPPYWALYDTKNPLVEYFYSFFFLILPNSFPLDISARIAEHVWMLLTAILVMFSAQALSQIHSEKSSGNHFTIGLIAGIAYLSAILNWRVTDCGLNIAMYQTLPELAAIILTIKLLKKGTVFGAVAMGMLVFAAWFVKQTSVISLFLPLLFAWFLSGNIVKSIKYIAIAVSSFLASIAIFFVSLAITDTLSQYVLGSAKFKSLIIKGFTFDLFFEKLVQNITLSQLSGGFFNVLDTFSLEFNRVLILFFPVALFLLFYLIFKAFIHKKLEQKSYYSIVLISWFISCMFQAFMGLLFYRHYFLSSIAPFILICILALVKTNRRTLSFFVMLFVLLVSVFSYLDERENLSKLYPSPPIKKISEELIEFVPHDSKVFLWGGLPHYFVYSKKSSDYKLNTWWSYINDSVVFEERDEQLKVNLRPDPPDYFIELYEKYPEEERLNKTVKLSPEILKKWTDREYKLSLTIPGRSGRYGIPVRVFKRIDNN